MARLIALDIVDSVANRYMLYKCHGVFNSYPGSSIVDFHHGICNIETSERAFSNAKSVLLVRIYGKFNVLFFM